MEEEIEKAQEILRRKTVDHRFRPLPSNMSDTGDTGVDDTHHNLLDSILTKQSVRKRAASNYDLVPMYQKSKQAEIQN